MIGRVRSFRIRHLSAPGAGIVVLGLVAVALAYFATTASGTGHAGVGTLSAPSITGATPGAGTAALSWSTVTPPGSGTVSYYVQRDGGSPGSNCPTSSSPTGVTSCTDSGLAAGLHHYTVTVVYHTWSATSSQTNVTLAYGAPSKLSFTVQPLSSQSIQAKGTGSFAVSVAVQDVNGNTVTSDSSTSVTLAIGTNPSSGVLSCSGGLSATASSGVASLSGCAITKSGTNYALTATSSPSYTVPSNANSFNVTAGAATTTAVTSGSGQSASISAAFASPLVATVTDTNGNPVSGAVVTFSAPPSGASGSFATCSGGNPFSYQCKVATGSNGQASSSTFTANAASGGYSVSASASGTTSVNFTLTNQTALAITSLNATTFTIGTAGSFSVTTTGAPTPALSESGSLPGGVTFTDNGNGTATLSGTPSATDNIGPYSFTITASNGVSPNATQSFTLTVAFSTSTVGTYTVHVGASHAVSFANLCGGGGGGASSGAAGGNGGCLTGAIASQASSYSLTVVIGGAGTRGGSGLGTGGTSAYGVGAAGATGGFVGLGGGGGGASAMYVGTTATLVSVAPGGGGGGGAGTNTLGGAGGAGAAWLTGSTVVAGTTGSTGTFVSICTTGGGGGGAGGTTAAGAFGPAGAGCQSLGANATAGSSHAGGAGGNANATSRTANGGAGGGGGGGWWGAGGGGGGGGHQNGGNSGGGGGGGGSSWYTGTSPYTVSGVSSGSGHGSGGASGADGGSGNVTLS